MKQPQKKIVCISGKIGSGKDYLADRLMEEATRRGYKTEKKHFAAALKKELQEILDLIREHSGEEVTATRQLISEKMNIPLDQTEYLWHVLLIPALEDPSLTAWSRTSEIRTGLQFLGTEVRRTQNPDYWVEKTHKEIESTEGAIFFTIADSRFTNEMNFMKEEGATLIRIELDPETLKKRRTRRDGLEYTEAQLNHIGEIQLDDYPNFDIIVSKSFDVGAIFDQLK